MVDIFLSTIFTRFHDNTMRRRLSQYPNNTRDVRLDLHYFVTFCVIRAKACHSKFVHNVDINVARISELFQSWTQQ